MFTIAAIWNWVLAVSFIALSRIDLNAFTAFGFPIPPSLLWFDAFFGLVFAFGIAFYIISQDMNKNHGLILFSIIEKFWVFIITLLHYLASGFSILAILIVAVDLIFGLLYIENLVAIRKMSYA